MKNHERFGKRIVGANKVVNFLRKFFRQKGGNGEEDMRKYFASWSPYRIRKVHVEHIGKNEIYRPGAGRYRRNACDVPLCGSEHSEPPSGYHNGRTARHRAS
ncbi:unnamed protein product, partial [Pylaiella littoralis]